MKYRILSLLLAILSTFIIGYHLPPLLDQFNDAAFSSATILDQPDLMEALREVQSKGLLMGIHGWRHENYSRITTSQAREAVENSRSVFLEAGLVPVAFLDPYLSLSASSAQVVDAINSTGVSTDLSSLKIDDSAMREYGKNWRDAEKINSTIFSRELERINIEKPTSILLHIQDWNPRLKQLISSYLSSTDKKEIFIRIDDVEVNTPPEKVLDLASLLNYPSAGSIILGVIPAGTLKGEDATLMGFEASSIFRVYWWYYMLFAFFPLMFFVSWRQISSRKIEHGRFAVGTPITTWQEPSVSLVIPAHNEQDHIADCLDALLSQDFSGQMEVIVVNDGSTDDTARIASRYPVTLLDLKKNLGKARALNVGIKKAKGDIIIFSDSDSVMDKSAVRLLAECLLDRPDAHAVAGKVLINNCGKKPNLLYYFQVIEYRIEQDINRFLQSLGGRVLVCPGPIFAVRREVMDSLKFSHQTIVEDADFTIHALKSSMSIVQEPRAIVYTWAPESVRGWFTQRKRWWYGNLQLWDMHKGWARRNPWMLLNYFGFINSIISILLLLLLPVLLIRYHEVWQVVLRSLTYFMAPLMLSCLVVAPFFVKDKKLMAMLMPYTLFYSLMKIIVVSYLYICYLSGRGIDVKFGPRVLRVR